MDWQWIANIAITGAVSVGGWVMKYFYQELRDIKRQLQSTREQFVHKEDLKEFKMDLNRRLDELKELIIFRVKD